MDDQTLITNNQYFVQFLAAEAIPPETGVFQNFRGKWMENAKFKQNWIISEKTYARRVCTINFSIAIANNRDSHTLPAFKYSYSSICANSLGPPYRLMNAGPNVGRNPRSAQTMYPTSDILRWVVCCQNHKWSRSSFIYWFCLDVNMASSAQTSRGMQMLGVVL